MAIIPLKQSITITRTEGDDSGWGGGQTTETFTLSARVDEKTQTVQNAAGEEIVTAVEITLDKLADIRYDDVITYEDELGRITNRQPERIEPTRGIGGKALLTTVYL